MKHILFKCALTDAAIDAYNAYMNRNTSGLNAYASKIYYGHVVYETKAHIVIREL